MKLRNAWITLVLLTLVVVGAGAGSGSASVKGGFSISSTIGTSKLANGVTLSGSVVWKASPSGAQVAKVVFSIDGTKMWTDLTSPYQLNGDPNGVLDTSRLTNGQHKLTVKAYASDGQNVSTQGSVTVSNKSVQPAFAVDSSIADGATLSGSLAWTASPSGSPVSKVEFLIDGALKWTESYAPYQFNGDNAVLDTTTLINGTHTLAVKAYAVDGRTATKTASAKIANGSVPAAFAVASSIADGATVGGSLVWTASPSGSPVSKVEFLIDGALKWTESYAPFQFNGDNAVLDTSTLSNATHMLAVIAYATDGRTASASSSVTVANGAPPPPPSSISALSGSIPRFGIATGYKILDRSAAEQKFELDQIQAVGAKIVRFDSLPGNQAKVDAVVAGVIARGMEPLLVLFGTTDPFSPSAAASFAGAQAAKWKGRVRLYEFANEPDLNGWTGTTYAQALIPAYNAIKAADPNAIVIAGALWKGAGGPVQFVTDMYNAGAKGHFDILSLHLYDDPFAVGVWNIWNMAFHMTPSVRSVMDAHGDVAIPIASTETGGPTTSYGEAGQASIIGHDFDALSDPRLAFICIYSMLDDVVTSQPGFGLLRPDRSERPALAVYKTRAGA